MPAAKTARRVRADDENRYQWHPRRRALLAFVRRPCRGGARVAAARRAPGSSLDLGLPDGSGIDFISEACSIAPCLVLTSASTRALVMGALRTGACRYLLKEDLASRLPVALKEMLAGGMPISPAAAAYVLERFRQEAPTRLSPPPTNRERKPLALLARGLTYAQIAQAQGVSINTVRTHVSSAYGKLQAANMAEAVMLALQEGWIEL